MILQYIVECDAQQPFPADRSVSHDRCKLSGTCEKFPICDDELQKMTDVSKIIGIHCSPHTQSMSLSHVRILHFVCSL